MNLILETDRLLLRPLELSDAEAMFAMDNNPEVHKKVNEIFAATQIESTNPCLTQEPSESSKAVLQ